VLVIDGGDSEESEAFYLVDALGADPKKTGFSPTLDRVDSLKTPAPRQISEHLSD